MDSTDFLYSIGCRGTALGVFRGASAHLRREGEPLLPAALEQFRIRLEASFRDWCSQGSCGKPAVYDLTSIADQLWQEQLGGKGNWINFRSMILANVSRFLTLEPGHLITTGTPEGVGPMKPGDTVTVPIKGIGMLSNPVVAEE